MKTLKGGNKMERSTLITIIVAVAAIVLIGIFTQSTGPTISANGQGTVKIAPDQARIYLNIVSNSNSADSAKSQNDKILSDLKSAIISKGFDESIIKVDSFSLYPQYEWVNGRMIEKGFTASHSVSIVLGESEFDKVGIVLDAATQSGVKISSVGFELTEAKRSEAKAEAIKLAADDAKTKAKAVAQGFDKRLGRLVSTEMVDYGYMPFIAYSEGYASDKEFRDSFTSFNPSEQDVTANVVAKFRIN